MNDACIIGAGGEISDFQAILHLLEEEIRVGGDELDITKRNSRGKQSLILTFVVLNLFFLLGGYL